MKAPATDGPSVPGVSALPAFAERTDETVRSFYERFPYPPPVRDLDTYRQRWRDKARRLAQFHLLWPTRLYAEELSVLVAGCGTSQAAKYALRWPDARVVGIDFSGSSVRFTNELKRKYRLDNLEVCQLAIERVSDLGMCFDHIVCTGVLHHLSNPDIGLLKLRDALKPDGTMHIMVYAPYGRAGVYMLQEFFRRVDSDDIATSDVVAALKTLPSRHPLANLLRHAPDFRSEAGIADALLHPQDRAYSVPEFFDLLRVSNLAFCRWLRQAQYSFHAGVMAQLPRVMRAAALSLEDQYAAAELFRGTMMRHSAIVCRDDSTSNPQVTFTGDAWLKFVPIRVAETVCIQDRLPPDIAAILINRAHSDTDICLPLRADEKHFYDAIDDVRTIGEIASKAAARDTARKLFERLWWHDQIVVDATKV